MEIKLCENISITEKEAIFHLWNIEYPVQLAYSNMAALDIYLNNLQNPKHYFAYDSNKIVGWAIVFKREEERWFAIIVDSEFQKKGLGTKLLNQLKRDFQVLNAWVIDHENYVRADTKFYPSPKDFYTKNGFETIHDVRLEIPVLSAVKIKWQANNGNYLFNSQRLGFRNWKETDLDAMALISGDKEVMEYFPNIQSREHTADFIKRMQKEFGEKGYCYFAVEILESSEFIGFIGLHEQIFESDFTPCVDIGWRLKKSAWHKGYATEGALRCIDYAFNNLKLKEIYSIATKINTKSIAVMKKAGMTYVKNFIFILLKDDERLKDCVLYKIEKQ